ncbi:fungal-specific transcription factor domain-containing protein [Aspergillus caelatus]|uniref:Fungal-specific transcription factor domain-containing protein n=1 Tax=Aspergillus caelatus TaxID=61420 RepID=A0A5N6ZU53_9EURO|nr:fungal-specific transcription factor domain-containing protein [Aspergillus caelatus]KAE8360466.1 fungal-specific transcription factor domain-containing protein [Aspergillus caelatus]
MSDQLKRSSSKRFRPKVPLEQRKRIIKACTNCRLRKRRCVLVSPDRCQNCDKTNSSCVFESEEVELNDLPASHLNEDGIDHEDVAAEFNKLYPEIGLTADQSAHLMKIIINSNRPSAVNQSTKQLGQVGATPDERPAPESTTTLPDTNATTFGGHEALAHKDFLDSATEAVSQTERPDFSDNSPLFYPENESYSEYEDYLMDQVLKDFPSQTEAEALISTFFCYAEANWYYFDEATFRSQLYALYRSDFATSIADAKLICLALTVFSMGSQFAHLHQGRPDSDAEGVNLEQTGIPGAKFFRHAQHLIPWIITCPSLEGVLSCLLAALYSLPIHNTNTCYTYLGLALRNAICLGLHRKSAGFNIPPQLSEIRNRVFWTTYSIERRVAISLGYPETLQCNDIDCPLPRRRADLDSSGSFRAERLVAYTKLTLLLNKAIQSKALDRYATEEIRRQLLAWKEELPAELTTLDGVSLRLNVHLQLHYCMVWTYISRAALISKVRSFVGNKGSSRDDTIRSAEIHELSKSCVQHAEQIIDLIELLRNRRQLARFSHTDFHCCSSATIIILLESILHPRLKSYSRVSTAMEALHFMARGSEFARNALKHVDNFQAVVNKALAAMSHQGEPGFDYRDLNPTKMSDSVLLPKEAQTADSGQFIEDAHQPYYGTSWERRLHEVGGETSINQPYYQGYDGALFDDIGTLLEDCSFSNQHLLGFDGLYAGSTLDDGDGL